MKKINSLKAFSAGKNGENCAFLAKNPNSSHFFPFFGSCLDFFVVSDFDKNRCERSFMYHV